MKFSKILIYVLLALTITVHANENYIEISQGEKFSEGYDYGGMSDGRGVGISVNQNFTISNLGVALSGANDLGYEIQIFSSETGNIANELLLSKIFYADSNSDWHIVDIAYTFLAGNSYVINMRPKDGGGFGNAGTLYIWTENQPQDNDYGIFNVVRGFQGYEPQPTNPLHPIFRFYTEQNQTTPIEFSITSGDYRMDAYGIGCDISLNSDDNCGVPGDLNNQQAVYVTSSTIVGSQKVVTIGYASDEPNLNGIAFELNFDSSKLSLFDVSNVFHGNIASGALDDVTLQFSWASLFGQFPGASQVDLATVTFDIIGYEPPTQLQTTPIELDVYSSHAGFDAFGIGCDISLDADDNCDSPDNLNNQQAVYVASSIIKGPQKEVTIGYASDSPNTTGLGFFLKYDSSKLNLNSVMELFQGCIACGELVEDGSLTFGYASLFGEFPGSNEVNLVKVTFDIIGYEPPIQSKQTISINNAPKGVLGRSSILEVVYDTSDNNNQLSGLGMRVHFNSSLLSFKEITDLIDQDIIVNGEGPFSDDVNYDNDPLTDQYMLFGWASLYNNWPNRELPTVLMNIAFDVSDTIDIDVTPSTNINFTDSSFTAGYEFSANSYVLEFQRATWDFDGDGNADALTDGLMMIRYLFGLRAELVTFSAMSDNSTLSPEEVIAEIEAALDIMDIDADGEFNALTDGLLLLRYLFGLRDDSLTNGAVGADATRSSNEDIQNYLESHMPAL